MSAKENTSIHIPPTAQTGKLLQFSLQEASHQPRIVSNEHWPSISIWIVPYLGLKHINLRRRATNVLSVVMHRTRVRLPRASTPREPLARKFREHAAVPKVVARCRLNRLAVDHLAWDGADVACVVRVRPLQGILSTSLQPMHQTKIRAPDHTPCHQSSHRTPPDPNCPSPRSQATARARYCTRAASRAPQRARP